MKIANIETQMTNWEKTRKTGKWVYIFVLGPLSGGIGFFFGRIIFDFLLVKEFESLSYYLITSFLFGVLFGLGSWIYNERKYKKYKVKH